MASEARDVAFDAIDAAKWAKVGDPPAAPPKPVREVRPSELSTKSYLESVDDVEEFILALKKELLAAVSANSRVRIR
ncbi:MAG: hypothetical protein ABIP81_07790 [Terriglobales bacterium]